MNKREFNAVLKSVSVKVKGRWMISEEKASALPNDVKKRLVALIVRHRAPILKVLIPKTVYGGELFNSWLSANGYLYESTNKAGFTFRHTCEHDLAILEV